MAEIRIGHDQVVLTINEPIRLEKGAIFFVASGTDKPEKVKKLSGSQPLVLVGDDGEIVAAWHDDLTENFTVARNNPTMHIRYEQKFTVLSAEGSGKERS